VCSLACNMKVMLYLSNERSMESYLKRIFTVVRIIMIKLTAANKPWHKKLN